MTTTRTPLAVEITEGAMEDLLSLCSLNPELGPISDRLLEKMFEGSVEAFVERSRKVDKTHPNVRTARRGPVQLTVELNCGVATVLSAGLVGA